VLYWVVKGKINRDIADILGAARRHVKKHLERVFVKLGVETRTAAAGDGDEAHPAVAAAVRDLRGDHADACRGWMRVHSGCVRLTPGTPLRECPPLRSSFISLRGAPDINRTVGTLLVNS
jgi:hypothetical protein